MAVASWKDDNLSSFLGHWTDDTTRIKRTKMGGAPGAGRGKKKAQKNEKISSFAEATAKATGQTPRNIQFGTRRGKKSETQGGWLSEIVGTMLDQGTEIDALVKLMVKLMD